MTELEEKFLEACKHGDINTVKDCIKAGVDIRYNDIEVQSMMKAVFHGHAKIVRLLLKKGANPSLSTSYGDTPLFLASKNGDVKIIKLLIQHGVALNVQEGGNRYTALMLAIQYLHTEITKLLIEAGANMNIKDKYGNTAFSIAKDGEKHDRKKVAGKYKKITEFLEANQINKAIAKSQLDNYEFSI